MNAPLRLCYLGIALMLVLSGGPASAATEYLRLVGSLPPDNRDLPLYEYLNISGDELSRLGTPGEPVVLDFEIDLATPGYRILPSGEVEYGCLITTSACFFTSFYARYLGGTLTPDLSNGQSFMGLTVSFPEGIGTLLPINVSNFLAGSSPYCYIAGERCSVLGEVSPEYSSYVEPWVIGEELGVLRDSQTILPLTLVYRDVVPTPAPASLILLGTGLSALAGRRWRRWRRRR